MVANPIIVALDTADEASALELARATRDHVGAFKVGLGLLHGPGPGLIAELVVLGLPVFADAKLHDIPTQVERAAEALGKAGARWVTAHASGGRAMLESAVAGLNEGSSTRAGVLAVTVLTSLDITALRDIGIQQRPEELAVSMAAVSAAAGTEGVVCSPHEIRSIRETVPGLSIVTPGIRPADAGAGDQRRIATPETALAAGADWLVIGRAITAADDPALAAATIESSLKPLIGG